MSKPPEPTTAPESSGESAAAHQPTPPASAADGAGHADHPVHQVNALAIFVWLVLLTGAEIGVVYLGLPKHLLVAALIGTALLKALLVAIYFMHLKFEGKLIWAMILGSVVLGAVFLLGLCPDLVYSSINLFR